MIQCTSPHAKMVLIYMACNIVWCSLLLYFKQWGYIIYHLLTLVYFAFYKCNLSAQHCLLYQTCSLVKRPLLFLPLPNILFTSNISSYQPAPTQIIQLSIKSFLFLYTHLLSTRLCQSVNEQENIAHKIWQYNSRTALSENCVSQLKYSIVRTVSKRAALGSPLISFMYEYIYCSTCLFTINGTSPQQLQVYGILQ